MYYVLLQTMMFPFGMQFVTSSRGGALTVAQHSLLTTVPISLAHTGNGRAEASEVSERRQSFMA